MGLNEDSQIPTANDKQKHEQPRSPINSSFFSNFSYCSYRYILFLETRFALSTWAQIRLSDSDKNSHFSYFILVIDSAYPLQLDGSALETSLTDAKKFSATIKHFKLGFNRLIMADGVGFEPTRRLHACWFLRPEGLTQITEFKRYNYVVGQYVGQYVGQSMAERVGFEPTVRLHVRRFSRPVLSTTQAPLLQRRTYRFFARMEGTKCVFFLG